MRWVVRIEREDDGSESDAIRIERSRMEDAAGLGLTLEDGKRIMTLLQKRVLADQLREHCRSPVNGSPTVGSPAAPAVSSLMAAQPSVATLQRTSFFAHLCRDRPLFTPGQSLARESRKSILRRRGLAVSTVQER
jgi:hypothetical protein